MSATDTSRQAPSGPSTPKAGLKVVVFGATGNVGTSVVEALGASPEVARVLGVARRLPEWSAPKTEWVKADLARVEEPIDDLVSTVSDADVVVQLAWLFQPTHDPVVTWRTNVLGSIRLFDAVAAAGVRALVCASSVGAYSPGPDEQPVDESWPTHGWPGAAYTREKAYVERVLDGFEQQHPGIRVVRIRPGFVFKETSASEQQRLFAGPLLPARLVRPGLVPLVPELPGLRFQAVHATDVGRAYQLATVREVRGAFNIAADPVVDTQMLADCLKAKAVRVPVQPVRAALSLAWRLHVVPASPGLLDAVLRLPLMDTSRARKELGWSPEYTSRQAIEAFLLGLRNRAGMATSPLAPGGMGGSSEPVEEEWAGSVARLRQFRRTVTRR
jgi:UDP-glucose 4-epimerase